MIDEVGQLQVLNLRLQIRHAVLERSAPGQHLWDGSARDHVEGAGRDLVTDLTGDGEGAQPAGLLGQVAEALAEIKGGRQQAKGCPYARIAGTGAAPIHNEPEQHGEFMRAVLE